MRQLFLTMVAAAGLLVPPATATGQNINMSADDEAPNDCASLNVQFDDRPAVRAEQSLTVGKSQGFIKMTAPRHGGIRVRGANRGDILVRVCSQRDFLDPTQQLNEGGVAGKVGAQDQGVDEESDQRFSLGTIASRAGRTNHNVVLSRVT